ncbi:MAG: helix-hairpin-helix domain-containing protein [Armatimonadetes bacterium]|nr:helix-hairpin-helix domain-containing protein [Armatimonadota bacterium]
MGAFNFSKNQELALLVIVGLALIGLSYGQIRSARSSAVKEPSVIVREPSARGDVEVLAPAGKVWTTREEPSKLAVHVAGSVKRPGVYLLQPGGRVVDAVHMAGGPTSDADLASVNLAARVRDGQQIMIQSKSAPSQAVQSPVSAPRSPARAAISGRTVNINTAGPEELDTLPGVGPVTAQKIIDYRNQIGGFTSIDQLIDVKGIGPKKFEQMRPFVGL